MAMILSISIQIPDQRVYKYPIAHISIYIILQDTYVLLNTIIFLSVTSLLWLLKPF